MPGSSLWLLLLLSCLLGLLGLPTLHAYCFATMANVSLTQLGTPVTFCEYKGLQLLPGSRLRTTNCEECTCSESVLQCCGFGSSAGVIAPPPGCKVTSDACKVRLVQSDDPEKDCVISGSAFVGRKRS